MDLETLDSLTSQLSIDDASTLLEELEGGQVNVEDELDTVRENTTTELIEAEGDEVFYFSFILKILLIKLSCKSTVTEII